MLILYWKIKWINFIYLEEIFQTFSVLYIAFGETSGCINKNNFLKHILTFQKLI